MPRDTGTGPESYGVPPGLAQVTFDAETSPESYGFPLELAQMTRDTICPQPPICPQIPESQVGAKSIKTMHLGIDLISA